MPKMLIGSRAAKHWFPDFPRNPVDTDYIDSDEGNKVKGIDAKNCPSFQLILDKYPGMEIATPEILYNLKLSHCFWANHVYFEKTLFDLQFFQKKGFRGANEELFWPLYKDCENRYGKKRAYLNKENDDFFKNAIRYQYNHDSVHQAVAYYDEPLYLRIKKDKTKALTSWDLFLQLPEEDKLNLVREESFVIAIERFKLNDLKLPPRVCYNRALKLLLTSLWKGRWAKFIAENYLALTQKIEYDWWQKFETARNEGRVLKYDN